MANVLVVEDDPLIASFIRKALARQGHEVEWVPTGNTHASSDVTHPTGPPPP